MFRNGKANSGKGRLRHQAGRCPKPGFVRGTGMRLDLVKQPPEQASALCFGSDIGEVDIAVGREAHKADKTGVVAGDGNDLPFQALRPLRTAPAVRNPCRTLGFRIFARAIADGVEDDVAEGVIVGEGCLV